MSACLILLLAAAAPPPLGVHWEVGRTLVLELALRTDSSFPTADAHPRLEVEARTTEDARIELIVLHAGTWGPPRVLARRTFAKDDPGAWVFLRVTLDRHSSVPALPSPPSAPKPIPVETASASTTPSPEEPPWRPLRDQTDGLWARASGRMTVDDQGSESSVELGVGARFEDRWSLGLDVGISQRALTPTSGVVLVPLTLRVGLRVFEPLDAGLSLRGELLTGDPGVALGLHAGAWVSARFVVLDRTWDRLAVGVLVEPQFAVLRPQLIESDGSTWTESAARLSGSIYLEWAWR